VALTHYPVVNKNGETIASAVTNLDLHDISRVAKTYGVQAFYVVTPLTDQKFLVERIVSHWTRGAGASYNPKRGEALALMHQSEHWLCNVSKNACKWEPLSFSLRDRLGAFKQLY